MAIEMSRATLRHCSRGASLGEACVRRGLCHHADGLHGLALAAECRLHQHMALAAADRSSSSETRGPLQRVRLAARVGPEDRPMGRGASRADERCRRLNLLQSAQRSCLAAQDSVSFVMCVLATESTGSHIEAI